MNSFKEWLSDYLRYFILALVFLLAILAIVLGVRLYQKSHAFQEAQGDPDSIQILTERISEETETEAEQTDKQKEKVSEKETEKETAKETETIAEMTKAPETQKTSETEKAPETQKTSETTKTPETQKTIETRKAEETEIPETKAPETDPPQTEPPQPVYLTMTGTCYFRSDHRIAMSFAIAALSAEGTTKIKDADCVRISYPNFYEDLNQLKEGAALNAYFA